MWDQETQTLAGSFTESFKELEQQTLNLKNHTLRHIRKLRCISKDSNKMCEQIKLQNTKFESTLISENEVYRNAFNSIKEQNKDFKILLNNQLFAQRMVENLINDLLDLAKMEQNTFKFNNSYFDLSSVISQALTMVLTLAS